MTNATEICFTCHVFINQLNSIIIILLIQAALWQLSLSIPVLSCSL